VVRQGGIGDRSLPALPADLSEKLREFVAAKGQEQDSEADGEDWEARDDEDQDEAVGKVVFSESETLVEDVISMGELQRRKLLT
jgi:hypothetical protein